MGSVVWASGVSTSATSGRSIAGMKWERMSGYDELATVLEIDGVKVARLCQRADGSWYAWLSYHRPWGERWCRDCTGYEAGRAGCEAWVQRHMERLAPGIAEARASFVMLPGRETGPRPPIKVNPPGYRTRRKRE